MHTLEDELVVSIIASMHTTSVLCIILLGVRAYERILYIIICIIYY